MLARVLGIIRCRSDDSCFDHSVRVIFLFALLSSCGLFLLFQSLPWFTRYLYTLLPLSSLLPDHILARWNAIEFINWLSGHKFRSPLDLTKVRLQASGDSGMIESLRKTIRTAGESHVASIHHRILQGFPPFLNTSHLYPIHNTFLPQVLPTSTMSPHSMPFIVHPYPCLISLAYSSLDQVT